MSVKVADKAEPSDQDIEDRLLGGNGNIPDISPDDNMRALIMTRQRWLGSLTMARVNLRLAKAMSDEQMQKASLAEGKKVLTAIDLIDDQLVEAILAAKTLPEDVKNNIPKEVEKRVKEQEVVQRIKEG